MGYKVLFSDLDGTLVHYPKEFEEYADVLGPAPSGQPGSVIVKYKAGGEERECVLLTSMTGGTSYISVKTIELIDTLRQLGVLFVIITGARASTYEKRRPSLPKADYELFENGGRLMADGQVEPQWTRQFEKQLGPYPLTTIVPADLPPAAEREGAMWKLATQLSAEGWTVDTRDYFANFRVDVAKSEGKTEADFDAQVVPRLPELGLQTTFNLGKADIYPIGSGKRCGAQHILDLKGWSGDDAVAMFDDDNDVELGKLCGKAYLPGITHPSVAEAVEKHLHWEVTQSRGFLGTEEALETILAHCKQGRVGERAAV